MIVLKISHKLFLSFGILLLLMICTSIAALYGLNLLFKEAEDTIHDIPMHTAFLEIESTTSKGHLYYEEMEMGVPGRTIEDVYVYWDEGIEFCNLLLDGGEWKGVRYPQVVDTMLRHQVDVVKEALSGLMEKGLERHENPGAIGGETYTAFKDAYGQVLAECEKAKAYALQRSGASLSTMETTFARSGTAVIVASFLLCSVGLLMSLYISRLLVKPINEVAELMDNANLNSLFHTDRKDEIGLLMKAFDKFVTSIRETLMEVSSAAVSVDQAGREILSGATMMSQHTKKQNIQTSAVSESSEEMAKSIQDSAQHLIQTKDMTSEAHQHASIGAHDMDETVDRMHALIDKVLKASQEIRELSDESVRIGKVATIIGDVTKQIRLVSLNASIEATKAGEMGKGFAVVAEEIKQLALRTEDSTQEIGSIIRSVQSRIKETDALMQLGKDEADRSVQITRQTHDMLKQLTDIFQQVLSMVNHVADAGQMQSQTSRHMLHNVREIDGSAQQINSGIQHITHSVENLNQLTGRLQERIHRFRLHSASESGAA